MYLDEVLMKDTQRSMQGRISGPTKSKLRMLTLTFAYTTEYEGIMQTEDIKTDDRRMMKDAPGYEELVLS